MDSRGQHIATLLVAVLLLGLPGIAPAAMSRAMTHPMAHASMATCEGNACTATTAAECVAHCLIAAQVGGDPAVLLPLRTWAPMLLLAVTLACFGAAFVRHPQLAVSRARPDPHRLLTTIKRE
ncbi:MAG: hypothetical protein Q7S96_01435 [bacterium]|nr:hypothetical protein [bacterium]